MSLHTSWAEDRSWKGQPLLIAVYLLVCLAALDSHAQSRFEGEGRVVALNAARGTVTLDHGPIPGLTAATRTEFPVRAAALLRKAQIDDIVRFSLVPAEESHGLLLLSELNRQVGAEPEGAALGLNSSGLLLWAVSGLWTLSMAALGFTAYALSRVLNQLRSEVRAGTRAQEHARQDLQTVVHTLRQIAATVWEGYLGPLRRRIETIEVIRSGNGREDEAPRVGRPALLVVRLGETNLFQTLRECLEERDLVQVVWDRRRGDPRPAREPGWVGFSHGDRRRPPPSTWTTLGFVLVPQGTAPATPTPDG